jgi:hypothetical protein
MITWNSDFFYGWWIHHLLIALAVIVVGVQLLRGKSQFKPHKISARLAITRVIFQGSFVKDKKL